MCLKGEWGGACHVSLKTFWIGILKIRTKRDTHICITLCKTRKTVFKKLIVALEQLHTRIAFNVRLTSNITYWKYVGKL